MENLLRELEEYKKRLIYDSICDILPKVNPIKKIKKIETPDYLTEESLVFMLEYLFSLEYKANKNKENGDDNSGAN